MNEKIYFDFKQVLNNIRFVFDFTDHPTALAPIGFKNQLNSMGVGQSLHISTILKLLYGRVY
ncbi:MAG: hypothetical protein ACKO96_29440, partial [Flammeovirgaceae bacterium]